MIVRIVIAVFISVVTGACYMAGLSRLISGLLIGFGVLASMFFGILFLIPPGSDRASFAVNVSGSSWPFFLLALILILMIVYLFYYQTRSKVLDTDGSTDGDYYESLSPRHLKLLGGGILLYMFSLFFPVLLWFPSDEAVRGSAGRHPEIMVLVGVIIFICGVSLSLYLLYKSTKGGTSDKPDLMRTAVPALFTVFHFDKIPALAAYLLIYSTIPEYVFPKIAALALAAYIPVSLFLIKTVASSTSTLSHREKSAD